MTCTLAIVTPVKLKLIRWFNVAVNVHVAFWPGTDVVNVCATPEVIVPGWSAGHDVEAERDAPVEGGLRVDEDLVRAADGELHRRVDEAARRADGLDDEFRAVGLLDRDLHVLDRHAVRLRLRRWSIDAVKVYVAFCPGAVVPIESGVPGVIGPLRSGGTTKRFDVGATQAGPLRVEQDLVLSRDRKRGRRLHPGAGARHRDRSRGRLVPFGFRRSSSPGAMPLTFETRTLIFWPAVPVKVR